MALLGSDSMVNMSDISTALLDKLLGHYRHLHANPELSAVEYQTCQWLDEQFGALGFETHRIGETGLAAVLRNGDGPVVAFRADIDGLPVDEETGVDYAATNGAMHACGHDLHMTVALAAAEYLVANRDAWAGTVEFILQPSEENVSGAKQMIADGLWDAIPHAEVVFGGHVFPLEVGQIRLAPGPFFSTVDTYDVEVRGRGGHGSMPENTIDTVVLTAAIVMRLQTVVSREVGLHERAVLTVGAMNVGTKENIIPEVGMLKISTRSYSEDIRARLEAGIRRIVAAEAAASGAPEPIITPTSRAGSVINDEAVTADLVARFSAEFGEDKVEIPEHPVTASEDFGQLAEAIGVPSVYWIYGGYTAERMAGPDPVPTNHSASFLPDPAGSIRTGVAAALTAMLSRLGR